MKTVKMLAALALLCATSTLAMAQAWPDRQIKLIVPVRGRRRHRRDRPHHGEVSFRPARPAGLCREPRRREWRRSAHWKCMRAEPDGYTLGAISDSPMTVNPSMYPTISNTSRCAISFRSRRFNHFPSLRGRASVGADQEHRGPDRLRQGEPRQAELLLRRRRQLQPLGLEMLAFQTGIKIVHVPYKGVGPGTTRIDRRRRAAHVQQRRDRAPHVQAGKNNGTCGRHIEAPARAAGRSDRRRDRAGLQL